jgi:transcriptional regulator with XRE-family HTH domain
MDETDGLAQGALVNIGLAIAEHLGTINKAELARRIGVNSGHVTRITQGEVAGLSVEMVLRIERALELPQGTIFRTAGLVSGDVTVSDVLAADDRLDPADRRNFIGLYKSLTGQQGQ